MAVNAACFCFGYVVLWSVADGNQSIPAPDGLIGRKEGADRSISCHCQVSGSFLFLTAISHQHWARSTRPLTHA